MNEVIAVTKNDYTDLIKVWEASVRATHDFLTETDIEHYKPLILNEYFDQLQLFCITDNERIAGFIGLDEELIQMLFVDPNYRGKGVGKILVNFAIENFSVSKVDVNEQNEQAVGFYKHLGFEVTECAEFDAAGKPYPILSMELKQLFLSSAFSAIVILATYFNVSAQSTNPTTETKFLKDVTATHLPIDPEAHPLDVVLIDVDGDGDLDAVLAMEGAPNRLYLNDGKGIFTWKKGVFAEKNHDTEHVRAGDFDKDGKLDLIFVAEDDHNHEFYLGNGDGTYKDVSDRLPAKSEANGLDIGDLNGDGLPDIVVGNTGATPNNFLWLNDPKNPGHFIDYTKEGLPNLRTETQSVKLVDLNGDKHLDLILGNEVPPNRLFINDGKGRFTEHPEKLELLVPLHTREVLAFDANGDMHIDILFLNLTSNGGKFEKDPTVRLLINDGKGNFKDETDKRIPKQQQFSTYAGIIFDFNHDGKPDVILSATKIPPFEPMQMQALQNDGKGNFKLATNEVIPQSAVGRSWGIAVGDVNKDGKLDLFVGQWGTQARLLLGK